MSGAVYVVLGSVLDEVGELLAAGEWCGINVDVEGCCGCVKSGDYFGVAFWAVACLGCLAGVASGDFSGVLHDFVDVFVLVDLHLLTPSRLTPSRFFCGLA